MLGSGTISGPEANELGCLLEMTKGGKEQVNLLEGEKRTFLEDGDIVTLTGVGEKNG